MPLITLTAQQPWYPRGWWTFLSDRQQMVRTFAQTLPNELARAARLAELDFVIEPKTVQVDLRPFSRYAVNVPGLRMHVQMTETPSEPQRLRLRDQLTLTLIEWFHAEKERPTVALDLFFGPGHGRLLDAMAKPTATIW